MESHTHSVKVYKFNELDDSAKEKAREWYRQGATDYEWWDYVYDDAKTIANIIGIDITNIYFSGFWSQGDGACFEGSYSYKCGGVRELLKYAPIDTELHNIAVSLRDLQRPAFYQLSAQVSHRGHYCHEGCTDISVYDDRDGDYVDHETHDAVVECLRDFMRWIYRRLESEYDYLMSDECVDEMIESNEYTFTEEGEIY